MGWGLGRSFEWWERGFVSVFCGGVDVLPRSLHCGFRADRAECSGRDDRFLVFARVGAKHGGSRKESGSLTAKIAFGMTGF
jgi:hypothetical protein